MSKRPASGSVSAGSTPVPGPPPGRPVLEPGRTRTGAWRVRVVLGVLAVLVALVAGVTTATARGSLGPHEARYSVTTDDLIAVDLGPLGSVEMASPLPLTLGVEVEVEEIPRSVTAVDPARTVQALGRDLESYVQFFTAPRDTIADAARALLLDAVRRTLLVLAGIVLATVLVRALLGPVRRRELAAAASAHGAGAARAVTVGAVIGVLCVSSVEGALRRPPEGRPSAVFDGTPLEGARITGRLAGVVDTYGSVVVDAYRENEAFYAAAEAEVAAAWDERALAIAAREQAAEGLRELVEDPLVAPADDGGDGGADGADGAVGAEGRDASGTDDGAAGDAGQPGGSTGSEGSGDAAGARDDAAAGGTDGERGDGADVAPGDRGDGDGGTSDDAGADGAPGDRVNGDGGTSDDAGATDGRGADGGGGVTGDEAEPGVGDPTTADDDTVRADEEDPAQEAEPIVVVLVADLHCNVGMGRIIRTVAERAGADLVLNAGDTTVNGTSVERYCVTAFGRAVPSGVPKVVADGNHDSLQTATHERQAGWTVLDGGVVEVAGLRILGDRDPKQTQIGGGTAQVSDETAAEAAERLARVACEDGGVDVLLVHTPSVGTAALESGCVPAQLSGHQHRRTGPVQVGRGMRYVSSTTAGATSGGATIGPLNGVASLTVLRFDPVERRFLDLQEVEVAPDGSATVGPREPWGVPVPVAAAAPGTEGPTPSPSVGGSAADRDGTGDGLPPVVPSPDGPEDGAGEADARPGADEADVG